MKSKNRTETISYEIFKRGKIRKKVLKRDGRKCKICDSNNIQKLHVHHIKYRRYGGKDNLDNLITLCSRCHYRIHLIVK